MHDTGHGVEIRVDGDGEALIDHVLIVTEDREIRPGLLLARTLMERQGGSLTANDGVVMLRLQKA